MDLSETEHSNTFLCFDVSIVSLTLPKKATPSRIIWPVRKEECFNQRSYNALGYFVQTAQSSSLNMFVSL